VLYHNWEACLLPLLHHYWQIYIILIGERNVRSFAMMAFAEYIFFLWLLSCFSSQQVLLSIQELHWANMGAYIEWRNNVQTLWFRRLSLTGKQTSVQFELEAKTKRTMAT
jgi:hypothetical protein